MQPYKYVSEEQEKKNRIYIAKYIMLFFEAYLE